MLRKFTMPHLHAFRHVCRQHPGEHYPALCALLLEVLRAGWGPAVLAKCLAALPARFTDDMATC
eukprot:3040070-Alexandrium_andersonii.AAC.1